MTLDMPDNLKSVDRTPSLAHLTRAAALTAMFATKGTSSAAPARIGQTFAEILNNHKSATALNDEDGPRADESAISYLNRHRAATAPGGGLTNQTGNGSASTVARTPHAPRPGQTPAEVLNSQVTTDEAAARHAEAEKAAEGLVSNAADFADP